MAVGNRDLRGVALRQLPVERWPTREEAAASRWFSPVKIGGLNLSERTWVPAMVPWRATEDGFVTPEVLAWYERFAIGQPGGLVLEATGIRDVPSGPLLRIGHDRYVEGLAKLVETVRRASNGRTKVFIQIIDFLNVRRRPAKDKFFARHLVVDDTLRAELAAALGDSRWSMAPEGDVRDALGGADEALIERVLAPRALEAYRFGYRERVTDTHLPHVAQLPLQLPGLFAAAAERAKTAGFDGVELHFAHAYTMASFLSATNTRTDGYGTTREGRARLPLEVIAEVRGRVGKDYALGCRFLGDEVIDGGSHVEDAAWFGARFAEAGLDFLSVSKGGKFDDAKQPKVGEAVYPYTGPSGHECMPTIHVDDALPESERRGPFGRNVQLSAEIRRAVRAAGFETPVIAAGGICSFWQAEEVLAKGEADLVASARQALADPDWFKKSRLGFGHEIRRCLFTNYCEALDQRHKQVTCQLWDRELTSDGNPSGLLAKDGKRRLVAPDWEPPA